MTDQPTLRDRIADVLATADGWTWAASFDRTRSPSFQGYQRAADAVLAILPETAERAAVLREAADVATQLPTPDCAEMSSLSNAWDQGTYAVAKELRRMVDEAQQPEEAGR